MIPPWLVVVACVGAEGGHEAGEVVAILADDMLLHDRESRLKARGI